MYKDKNNRIISERDIIVCNYKNVGWIFKDYNEKYYVAWDLLGPSCENSSPIEDYLDEYSSIKIVGKLI